LVWICGCQLPCCLHQQDIPGPHRPWRVHPPVQLSAPLLAQAACWGLRRAGGTRGQHSPTQVTSCRHLSGPQALGTSTTHSCGSSRANAMAQPLQPAPCCPSLTSQGLLPWPPGQLPLSSQDNLGFWGSPVHMWGIRGAKRYL
ncbi:hypothetical protein P7K49_023634, partial [Saguinus oedipus]